MGGTFDPLHVGHLIAASEVFKALSLDRVVFVPAGRPWQKLEFSEPEDRFLMTALGAAGHGSFSVSRIELDRRGPTFTVETLEVMLAFYGSDTSLFFIAGTDAAVQLESWHRFEAIRELAEVAVVSRPGTAPLDAARSPKWPLLHRVDIPGVDISSTEIRARIAGSKAVDFLVPPAVLAYIKAQGLYSRPEVVDA